LELVDRFVFATMGTCPKPDIHTPIQKTIWFIDAALYFFSALGFLIYGGRFVTLRFFFCFRFVALKRNY
jgi:hypothetical protein